ncbi:MAG: hypothetical protein H0U09_02465 [Geodermatophilaceae bacterium]|nr:hypothetical protein [Geodermatophilaceae bacterium]
MHRVRRTEGGQRSRRTQSRPDHRHEGQPPHVLLVRGSARVEIVDGVPEDYLKASRKLVGEQGMAAFEEQVRTLYDQMARIVLTPDWAKVLDFETRAPEFVHQLAAAKGLGPPS